MVQYDLHFFPSPQKVFYIGGCIPPLKLPLTISSDLKELPFIPFPHLLSSHSASNVRITYEKTIPSQGYHLEIKPNLSDRELINLKISDQAGLRYGLETLRQIVSQKERCIPNLIINDRPAIPMRGLLLDISRGRVPTREHLRELIRVLTLCRFNHLQLYTEHTFAYPDHPEVWREASPLLPDEIKELDILCRENGIKLVANQATLGHMEKWVKHPQYTDMAELQGQKLLKAISRGKPVSLSPAHPATLPFIKGLLNNLFPLYSCKWIHLNCDETWDLGKGLSKDIVRREGLGVVYGKFVGALAEFSIQQGFKPMIWGDGVLKDLRSLKFIPKETVIVLWGYEPQIPWKDWATQILDRGYKVWFAPGTSSWLSITGRTYERRANVWEAVQNAIKLGISGVLLTEWGDKGHIQQFPISLSAIVEAASMMWNPDHFSDLQVVFRAFLGEDIGPLWEWILALGDVDLHLRQMTDSRIGIKPIVNRSALFNELIEPWDIFPIRGNSSDWEKVYENLKYLHNHLPSIGNQLVAREVNWTLQLAKWTADKAIFRRRSHMFTHQKRKSFRSEFEWLREEFRNLWAERSRPGGLQESENLFNLCLQSYNGS